MRKNQQLMGQASYYVYKLYRVCLNYPLAKILSTANNWRVDQQASIVVLFQLDALGRAGLLLGNGWCGEAFKVQSCSILGGFLFL